MELVSEIFPGYNPLSNIIAAFRSIIDITEIPTKDILELLDNRFSEAGVLVESPEDMKILINLLVEYQILAFEKTESGEIVLNLHQQFREDL